MIGFYNYTVLLTYLGFGFACCGIYSAVSEHQSFALLMLMLAGLCDMFDGKIAKTRVRTPAEQRFGIQIDSLSDLVCFGLLPAVIGYSVGLKKPYHFVLLVFFTLAALIRLAYFNVMEEERQSKTTERRREYEGLPVTSVSLIFPLLYSFRRDIGDCFPAVYGGVMLLVSLAFITKIRVRKPGMRVMLCFILVGALELAWLIYKGRVH